ncbi:pentatricopeptide repeat-containing protein [Corchorus olitorius]|uniref:Pentatricopeptide repeat-containing protein n=1 Tax=Corchorus olitorius TaxID=93759 RepID=A0A1R3KTF0_9ROSI|nr:pentatricopeptide repeat-containing protein [Corchorus olitorius]
MFTVFLHVGIMSYEVQVLSNFLRLLVSGMGTQMRRVVFDPGILFLRPAIACGEDAHGFSKQGTKLAATITLIPLCGGASDRIYPTLGYFPKATCQQEPLKGRTNIDFTAISRKQPLAKHASAAWLLASGHHNFLSCFDNSTHQLCW